MPERVETFTYDPLGQLVEMTDPTGQTTFTYDAEGGVLGQSQPGGKISLELTPAGRVSQKTLADGSTLAFTYDETGLPATASNPLGVETYTYDEAAQLTQVSRQGETGGPVVTDYVLDANGRPTQITHTTTPAASPFAATSPLMGGGLGGLTMCLPVPDYLADRTLPGAGSTPGVDAIDLTYTYNSTGTVASTGRTDTGRVGVVSSQTQNATYDGLDRLTGTQTETTHLTATGTAPQGQRAAVTATTEAESGQGCGLIAGVGYPTPTAKSTSDTSSEAFTWDVAGNRTSATTTIGDVATATEATYNELNQVTTTSTTRGPTPLETAAYTYDQAGNRTQETLTSAATLIGQDPERVTSYSYDATGRLAEEASPEATTTYQRDALGRLAATTQATVLQERTTTYTWDGLTLSGQDDSVHGATSYLPDAFGRTTAQTGTAANPEGGWLLTDNLTSTIATVTPGGQISQIADWGTFGAFDAHTAGWDTQIGYTSEATNPATGTVSFYARDYDPTTATFTTPDAWEGLLEIPETLNSYAYVLGDPLSVTDELGFRPDWTTGDWWKSNWRNVTGITVGIVLAVAVDVLLSWCIAGTLGACSPIVGAASGWVGSAANWAIAGDSGTGNYTARGFAWDTGNGLAWGAATLGLGAVPGVRTGAAWAANKIAQSHLVQGALRGMGIVGTRLKGSVTVAAARIKSTPKVAGSALRNQTRSGTIRKTSILTPTFAGNPIRDLPRMVLPRSVQVSMIVRRAATGSGNFGIGGASIKTTLTAGRQWVGPGYRLNSAGNALISRDGLRQYRFPTWKPQVGAWQSNFQSRRVPAGSWGNSGHLVTYW